MVLADDLARCLTTEVIPIGILTTLMGAPLFIYLLRRAGREWRKDLRKAKKSLVKSLLKSLGVKRSRRRRRRVKH